MKLTSFIFLLLIAFFSSLSKAKADLNLIQNTCKQTPNYNLCVSVLNSNPKSRTADISGLGLIIVGEVKGKATSAMENINKLIETNPKLRRPLAQCSQSYNFILMYGVPEAVEALSKGDPKFAEDGMNNCALESQNCENSFKPNKSPLNRLNDAVHDLSAVTVAIIRMLL